MLPPRNLHRPPLARRSKKAEDNQDGLDILSSFLNTPKHVSSCEDWMPDFRTPPPPLSPPARRRHVLWCYLCYPETQRHVVLPAVSGARSLAPDCSITASQPQIAITGSDQGWTGWTVSIQPPRPSKVRDWTRPLFISCISEMVAAVPRVLKLETSHLTYMDRQSSPRSSLLSPRRATGLHGHLRPASCVLRPTSCVLPPASRDSRPFTCQDNVHLPMEGKLELARNANP
ncbi:hypothetical protein B0T19DRAFT_74016 [Cercophora scortea]|uniref:Uncharacterized protein n=1 Tax=Cercophora scortea TaxID=314031 RepID=A0AAE0MMC8_9PEZI|nr:hypothetical protein B0T19DRAFT_74016 [Cercophora scortea]